MNNKAIARQLVRIARTLLAGPSDLPTYTQLGNSPDWKLVKTQKDPHGLNLDGDVGDYRDELWKHKDGHEVTVSLSREFGIEEVFPGNELGRLKEHIS